MRNESSTTERRKKILLLSDHPLVPSGVGIQAKYLIEGLLRTGRYKFFCFGGAVKHPDYTIQSIAPEVFGEGNWLVMPVDGHGSKEQLRQALYVEKPDAVVLFTDPRFFTWVWEMEDEVRRVCPLLYWHVWDNDPIPDFNSIFYRSTDRVVALSLKTYGILQALKIPGAVYIPHALPDQLFKPLDDDEVEGFKRRHYGPHADHFVVMWNNRNARRKQTGDVVEAFSIFARRVGRERVSLFMHTQVRDPEGQDILAVAEKFGVAKNMMVSEDRVESALINGFYNAADVTLNISSNEGFGLGTLESLYAGTPIVVHMTGGLQFQIGDWWEELERFDDQTVLTKRALNRWRSRVGNWWGVPVFPSVRNCVGSQQVPYIYDDRASNEDVANALERMFKMSRQDRRTLGVNARAWATSKFNAADVVDSWARVIDQTIDDAAARRVSGWQTRVDAL